MAGHRGVHLLRAAEIKLVGLEFHPRRVVDRLAGVDAEQDVVRGGVVAGQIVGVAGRDQRAGPSAGRCRSPLRAFLLDPDPVVLDLDVEVLLAEDLLIPGAEPLGLGRLAVEDVVGKLGRGAARQADQPLGVPLEDLLVDPRLVVEAFQKRERRQPHQVAKARGVSGEQRQVERRAPGPIRRRRLRSVRCPGATYASSPTIGIDPGRLGLAEELDGAVEIAVIGQRQRGHAERLGALDQVRDLARAVEQAVMAVAMEMDERPAGHRDAHSRCGSTGALPAPSSRSRRMRDDSDVPVAIHAQTREPATGRSLP